MAGVFTRKRFRQLITVDVIVRSQDTLEKVQELVARLERDLERCGVDEVAVRERPARN